ncbi:MAG TPA: hypothetical protein ENJ35_07300, partial [Gammaproteobacteria bacterium]|nr:hypothetical protein [Gammaproteobacteria bacterium]
MAGAIFLVAALLASRFSGRWFLTDITDTRWDRILALITGLLFLSVWYFASVFVARKYGLESSTVRQLFALDLLADIIPLLFFPQMRLASLGIGTVLGSPFLLVASLCGLRRSRLRRTNRRSDVMFAVISSLLLLGIIPSVDRAVNSLIPALQNPSASYDEKMTMLWGDHYRLVRFMQQRLSPDATVVLPPSAIVPEGITLWQPWVHYFLYPRQVVSGSANTTCESFENEGI